MVVFIYTQIVLKFLLPGYHLILATLKKLFLLFLFYLRLASTFRHHGYYIEYYALLNGENLLSFQDYSKLLQKF